MVEVERLEEEAVLIITVTTLVEEDQVSNRTTEEAEATEAIEVIEVIEVIETIEEEIDMERDQSQTRGIGEVREGTEIERTTGRTSVVVVVVAAAILTSSDLRQ